MFVQNYKHPFVCIKGHSIRNHSKVLLTVDNSRVGKGTLIDKIMAEFPNKFGFSVSHTTRKPRNSEQNGVHYHFTNLEEMNKEISEGKFVEFANVHGNLYGTSKAAVDTVMATGKKHVFLILMFKVQNKLKNQV